MNYPDGVFSPGVRRPWDDDGHYEECPAYDDSWEECCCWALDVDMQADLADRQYDEMKDRLYE